MIPKPMISIEEVATLHRLLNEHHILFASVYGKWEVTVNYHMALHIPDIIAILVFFI